MNLRVEPVSVRFERPVGETTLKAVVEGSLSLPAGLPDIGRVVRVSAIPRLLSAEARTDQVALEGTLDVSLLYAALPGWEEAEGAGDDEEPYGQPSETLHRALWRRELPFQGVVDLPGATEGVEVIPALRVDEIRATPTKGGRGLDVDAVLEASVRCVRGETVEIPEVAGEGVRSLKRAAFELRVCEARLRREASIQGRLILPEEAPAVARPLDVDVAAAVERVVVGDGEAEAEGVLDVHLAYAPGEGGDMPVEFAAWSGEIRFVHRFRDSALAGLGGQEGHVQARVLSVDVEPAGDGRGIEVFTDVELVLEVGGTRTVHLATGAAETGADHGVETRTERLSLETVVGEGEQVAQVSGTVEVGEDHPAIERLLAHEARAEADEVLVLGDKVSVAGHVHLSLLYIARDGETENEVHYAEWKGALPVQVDVPIQGVHPSMRARVELSVDDIAPDLLNRETVEWKGRVRVAAVVEHTRDVDAVVEAVVVPAEEPDPPTYTFKVVEPGDTLWKLARRYRTSQEAIVAANPQLQGVESVLVPGSKVCIPRHRPQALVPLNGAASG